MSGINALSGEVMIGFDAREWWLDFQREWDDKRKSVFLLNEDIEKPLSVDDTVWPSLFDMENSPPAFSPELSITHNRCNCPLEKRVGYSTTKKFPSFI